MHKIRFIFELLLLFIVYIISPEVFCVEITTFLLIFYLYQVIMLIKITFSSGDRISFNLFFILMYTLCTYIVPTLYILDIQNELNTFITHNSQYINPALILSSLAISCYSFGYSEGLKKGQKELRKQFTTNISINTLKHFINILTNLIVLFTLYLVINFKSLIVPGTNDISSVYVTVINIIYILTIILCGYLNKSLHLKPLQFVMKYKIIIACVLIVIMEFLFLGDRIIPLNLILTMLFVYDSYIKKLNGYLLSLSCAIGLVILFFIGLTRNLTDDTHNLFDVITIGVKYASNQGNLWLLLVQDVIPANLDMYLGLEWLDKNDTFYLPGRLFIYLLAPLPFVPSFLTNMMYGQPGIMNISSAMLLTNYNQSLTGTTIGAGIGTHMVIDIYISWGVIGTILIFSIYGYLIGLSQLSSRRSIIFLIIYAVLVSNSIYLPRGSFYTGYREIVYIIIVYYIIKSIILVKKKNE